jgi:hypothetical protein
MQNDSALRESETGTGNVAPATTRADAYRERFRQAQVIAAQVSRARAAGEAPDESDTKRLVAEFHARGGQVTICPPGDDSKLDSERRRTERGKASQED